MTMDNPAALWLLALAPALGLLFWFELRHSRRALDGLDGRWRAAEGQNAFGFKWFFSLLCFAGFFLFSVLALAGVRWGEESREQDRRGLDVAFALDVSRSMLAADVKPSRLDRAVDLVRTAVRDLPGLRASLVGYKGKAVRLSPMSADLGALENALRAANPDLTSARGGDQLAGLGAAAASFPAGGNRHRLIVLLTDGEGIDGRCGALAARLRREGTPIVCVGLGNPQGSLVQLPGGRSLADASGNPVLTRQDQAGLRALAAASGGLYLSGGDPGAYQALPDAVRNLPARTEREGFYLVPTDRGPLFVGLALACLAGYWLVRSARWRLS